jgi:hypothetical protein
VNFRNVARALFNKVLASSTTGPILEKSLINASTTTVAEALQMQVQCHYVTAQHLLTDL